MLVDSIKYAGVGLVGYTVFRIGAYALRAIRSPLNEMQCPPRASLLLGNMNEFMNGGIEQQRKWVAAYGETFAIHAFLGSKRVFTMDTKAIHHILQESYNYQKPEVARHALGQIVGNGVLVAEEDAHARQRRILSPAFGAAQIRRLTSVFVEKAIQLRDVWAAETSLTEEAVTIDVYKWLSLVTIDIIGVAGFNYDFHALDTEGPPNELNEAFNTMWHGAIGEVNKFGIVQALIPAFRAIPTARVAMIDAARGIMVRIAEQLLRDSKADIIANDKESFGVSQGDRGRDLLSLLLRANMAKDLPDSQRLTDTGVIDQIPTFLAAGHDTTSNATTWALFALALDPRVQAKLAAELNESPTDTPTMEELQALPYLDAFTREALRMYAPVANTVRIAMKDDLVPLDRPYKNHKGELVDVLRVCAGDIVIIPVQHVNQTPEIWGVDGEEFKPERWENLPSGVSQIPGIPGTNSLSFIGGQRGCIGYRFAIVEMKALLYTLVRAFEFDLAVPAADVSKKIQFVMRPLLLSDPKAGNQLPLLVRPRKRDY